MVIHDLARSSCVDARSCFKRHWVPDAPRRPGAKDQNGGSSTRPPFGLPGAIGAGCALATPDAAGFVAPSGPGRHGLSPDANGAEGTEPLDATGTTGASADGVASAVATVAGGDGAAVDAEHRRDIAVSVDVDPQ